MPHRTMTSAAGSLFFFVLSSALWHAPPIAGHDASSHRTLRGNPTALSSTRLAVCAHCTSTVSPTVTATTSDLSPLRRLLSPRQYLSMAFVTPGPMASDRPTCLPSSTFLSAATKPGRPTFSIRRRSSVSIQLPRNPVRDTSTMSVVDVKTYEITMPALSSTMTEGRIVQWLKQPGEKVESGEMIMVVESDKADMDVESFDTGYLAAVLVDEGDSCDVGLPVGILVEHKDDIDKVRASAPSTPTSTHSTSPETSVKPPVDSQTNSPPKTPSAAKPDLVEVFMPALSSTMTEGKIVEWLRNEGDAIQAGEMIMVVESDKADMDVESFDSGILAHVSVEAGESTGVGEPVAYIAKSESDVAAVKSWAQSQGGSASPAATTETVPSGSTAEPIPSTPEPQAAKPSTIVNEGRIVASPLAKATAKKKGIDLRYVQGTGPGGRIVEKDVLKAEPMTTESVESESSQAGGSGKVIATPDAKKTAKKEKIDLSTVKGTGTFGRITAEDVLKAAGKAPAQTSKPLSPVARESSSAAQEKRSKPAETPAGAVAMNAMQKAVVQNMNASLSVPVFRLTYKIKTGSLDELYAKLKPKGVTMSALLAKAVALTLLKHPIMNAAYAENSTVYRPEINVAMAVAMQDGGLITPTLKDADKTDLYSLSRNWKDLVKRSMEKKLSPDEYNSGTFFISNLGMFGVEQFDAILPPGAPGILAIGASKPVVGLQKNGLIGTEKEMSVTLTADHRHIYGADGAKFLKDLCALIESDVTELLM